MVTCTSGKPSVVQVSWPPPRRGGSCLRSWAIGIPERFISKYRIRLITWVKKSHILWDFYFFTGNLWVMVWATRAKRVIIFWGFQEEIILSFIHSGTNNSNLATVFSIRSLGQNIGTSGCFAHQLRAWGQFRARQCALCQNWWSLPEWLWHSVSVIASQLLCVGQVLSHMSYKLNSMLF